MELGEKIKAARLEMGLSQRQLCGEFMTRNMLSMLENGAAKPSMETLRYLAERLRRPLGYFLEEPDALAAAREAFALGDLAALRRALDQEHSGEEGALLEFYCHLMQGARALAEEKLPYARTLLERALEMQGIYITKPLRQRARVLLTLAGGKGNPDNEDTALLALAMEAADPRRKAEILGAAADRENPRWAWAMAQAKMALGEYAAAGELLEKCPDSRQVWQAREVCCRETGDFKGAYEAACKLR